MLKSKFTDEQIVWILREADRDPGPTVAQRTVDLHLEEAVEAFPRDYVCQLRLLV